jgi:hypothetical protein
MAPPFTTAYASYIDYPVPTKLTPFYESCTRFRRLIPIVRDSESETETYTRTVNLWDCGCISDGNGQHESFAPGEMVRINRISLECPKHMPTDRVRDQFPGCSAQLGRNLGKKNELPPPRPVKHVRFSTDEPEIIGLGGEEAMIPTKDVGSVKIPRKLVAGTS